MRGGIASRRDTDVLSTSYEVRRVRLGDGARRASGGAAL